MGRNKTVNKPIPIDTTEEAKPRYELVEFKGQMARKYPDGTIRNEKGHTLALPPELAKHAITSANAHDMLKAREAKRMRLYAEGAQLGVLDQALIEKYGTDAHLVERARTLQEIASTPDAGKAAVMADAALQKAQGYDTKYDADQRQPQEPATRALLDLIRFITQDRADVVDADVIPMRSEIEADTE